MSNRLKAIFRPVVAPVLWVHHRLTPRDSQFGWTPYLWLPYLVFFFLNYTDKPFGALRWTLYAVAGLVFIILYFRAYHDAHRGAVRELGWIIAAMTLMGCGFMWPDGNGLVFFIYAAALCGSLGSVKRGARALLLVIAASLISAYAVRLNVWALFYVLFFTVVLGLANLYFGEMTRKNRALKLSQEEIRKLAAGAERERIARDLHDLLGHTLTLITVKAELAATLAERDLAGAAREIRDVERISREALAQVREAVGGYRSGGLAGELANARVALTAANVRLAEKVDPPQLSPAQDSALAMVLREAVTNVVRHSGAQHCRIEVENGGQQLRLLVEDDGRGGALHEGNGLRGMRERLHEVSGQLEIDSGHGGTRLTVRLPLNAASREFGPVMA
ncbi:MAG TPA: sensor histidine kinase [Gammaproteobacteria bacterium]|nr:sensor histidine kinase [Gammaproteobacteria bacterium]